MQLSKQAKQLAKIKKKIRQKEEFERLCDVLTEGINNLEIIFSHNPHEFPKADDFITEIR